MVIQNCFKLLINRIGAGKGHGYSLTARNGFSNPAEADRTVQDSLGMAEAAIAETEDIANEQVGLQNQLSNLHLQTRQQEIEERERLNALEKHTQNMSAPGMVHNVTQTSSTIEKTAVSALDSDSFQAFLQKALHKVNQDASFRKSMELEYAAQQKAAMSNNVRNSLEGDANKTIPSTLMSSPQGALSPRANEASPVRPRFERGDTPTKDIVKGTCSMFQTFIIDYEIFKFQI